MTLKELRVQRGLTIQALADRLALAGIGTGYPRTVGQLEDGTNSPSIRSLAGILRALNYSLEITAIDQTSGERVGLELPSLMGMPSRAKDTGGKGRKKVSD
jgi:transcriptional regulator with XRE-family HTH domain